MTITTLILLLATGIVAVIAVDNCLNQNKTITNCCDVGKYFTFVSSAYGSSGVYLLNNFCGDNCIKADAYCDTINGGGGWLVVQRRQDGSGDFNRTWMEYEDGFGKLTGEFWYGLKALHCLTGQGGWEMRMDIKFSNGTDIFLQYEHFIVASAKDKYKLTVGEFQGTTTDPIVSHNGMYFSTKDNDNDERSDNCALARGNTNPIGGWWFNSGNCWYINPNIYYNAHDAFYINNIWYSLYFIEMKIRPKNCNI